MTRARAPDDVPTYVIIPAFMISELKFGLSDGVRDIHTVSGHRHVSRECADSMGMMMLPPVLISLPFKILLFVLVDGWGLVVKSLVQSFAG